MLDFVAGVAMSSRRASALATALVERGSFRRSPIPIPKMGDDNYPKPRVQLCYGSGRVAKFTWCLVERYRMTTITISADDCQKWGLDPSKPKFTLSMEAL